MRPRVFIDTNTLVSGLLFVGNESRLLDLALSGRVKLVLSEQVIEETTEVLVERFGLDPGLSKVVVAGWSKIAEIVSVTKEETTKFRDPVRAKDAGILAAAVKSEADFFVTGDKGFHRERVRRVINVVRTRKFLSSMKALS
jgi:putative PIN family toxin of toxin-antitoxin system